MRRVLALLLVLFAGPLAAQPVTYPKDTVTIETASGAKHRFNVELATSPAQIAQGLMFRRQMAADAGMLFIFERPDPATFWMKNTYIPLDMIFIGPDGRILNIAERTIPLTETPVPATGPTRAVLEVNGGTSSRLGIKPGDRVRHSSLP
ncbi:MAG: DUF192 domain-containing protein [Alphaproteobacteria bacterium]|nr:DUF192 domain-containing protein [Alphaproteobacteria bacterium]